jgi:hypothetical protein
LIFYRYGEKMINVLRHLHHFPRRKGSCMPAKNTTPETKLVSVEVLTPDPTNARTHSPEQVREIARSIEEFGFRNPILADEHNVIRAGHGRLQAALYLGLSQVPVTYITGLSPAQLKAYMLADNKLAAKAGWDEELLRLTVEDIVDLDPDFDISVTGFSPEELDAAVKASEPQLPIKTEQLRPIHYARILISIPVDEMIHVNDALGELMAHPGIEVDYSGN